MPNRSRILNEPSELERFRAEFFARSGNEVGPDYLAQSSVHAFFDRSETMIAGYVLKTAPPFRYASFVPDAARAQLAFLDAHAAQFVEGACIWFDGTRIDRIGRAREIARLSGGAATLRRRLGVDLEPLRPFAARTAHAVDTARTALGARTFDTAFREGEALDPVAGDIVRLALGTPPTPGPVRDTERRPPHPGPWQQLSAAEREIAVLAAAGWTNAAIAARRGSSQRTVDTQIATVLQKLSIRSRTGIADSVPGDQRDRVRLESDRRPRR